MSDLSAKPVADALRGIAKERQAKGIRTLKAILKRLMREHGVLLRSIPHPLRPGDSMLDYAETALELRDSKAFGTALAYVGRCIKSETPEIRTRTKRASYREGVAWIALNDEPGDDNPDSVSSYISTALLADLFGKTTEQVARDICRYRDRPVNPRSGD